MQLLLVQKQLRKWQCEVSTERAGDVCRPVWRHQAASVSGGALHGALKGRCCQDPVQLRYCWRGRRRGGPHDDELLIAAFHKLVEIIVVQAVAGHDRRSLGDRKSLGFAWLQNDFDE